MKTHSSSPRAAFRILAALLVAVALLFAAGASAQSTNWLSGVNVLSNSIYGSLVDNDVVDGATLIITNVGALTANQLNVGPTSRATNTLDLGGTLTVNTLLATNVVMTGATTNLSILNFNAGTLITSNGNGLAANILLASNVSWIMNSSWTMNGGTNIFSNVATNGNAAANLHVGTNAANVQVNVNSNAVWWNATPTNSSATNTLQLVIGNTGTNNLFTVNGGTLIATNRAGANDVITVGVGAGNGNQLIVTNGGQVFLKSSGDGGKNAINIAGSNNALVVVGVNGAGRSALVDCGKDRISVNGNNLLRVDQGGVITNCVIYNYNVNSSIIITNGGLVYANGGANFNRQGNGTVSQIAGADANGNPATLNGVGAGAFILGGSSQDAAYATNGLVWVGQGGLVTNVSTVTVGLTTNAYGNRLIITNGGQMFSINAAAIGSLPNANSNSVTISGAFGTTNSLWNLGFTNLIIGNNQFASNNYVTLNAGGILTNVTTVILGGFYSVLNFDGGTLAAATNGNLIATNSTTISTFYATNFVRAGGAIINSGAFSITNVLPLLQDPNSIGGGLTKLGSGNLTMLGANTYTGPTVINGGLTLNSSASQTLPGNITGSGALTNAGVGSLTLAGTNTYSGPTMVSAGKVVVATGCSNSILTVASGATNGVLVQTADGQWGCQALTNKLGGVVEFNFAAPASTTVAPINVSGTDGSGNALLSLAGVRISVLNGVSGPAGTVYPLIQYAGTFATPTIAATNLPAGVTGHLTNDPTTFSINLVIDSNPTASATVYWAGDTGFWDINTTLNWKDYSATGVGNVGYLDGQIVVLDDSSPGAGPFAVAPAVAVNPASVTVNVTNKNYTLAGSFAIGGGAFTKNGPGTLTLANDNAAPLASTSLTVAGGTLLLPDTGTDRIGNAVPVTLAGGTLALAGTVTETAGVLTVGGTGVSTINFGSGSGILAFADSSAATWTGTLQITNWAGSTNGGGTDRLFVGSTAGGLTASQLARIGFVNPLGTNGLFTATILSTGEVVPNLSQTASDQWKPTAGGYWDWNNATNWVSGIAYPNGIGSTAILSTNIVANQTINLNTNITVGTLILGDTTTPFASMTINSNTANGMLTFDTSAGNALLARAATSSPGLNDTISANVVLNKSLTVQFPWLGTGNGIVMSNVVSGAGGITLTATNMPVAVSDPAQFLDLVNTNNSFSGQIVIPNGELRYRGNVLSGQNSALGNSTSAVLLGTPKSLSVITNNIQGSYNGSSRAQSLRLIASDDASSYVFNRDLDFSGLNNQTTFVGGRSVLQFDGDGAGGVNSNTLTIGGVVTLTSSNRIAVFGAIRSLMTIYFTNNIQNGTNNGSGGLYWGANFPGGLATSDGSGAGGIIRLSATNRTYTVNNTLTAGTLIIEGSVPSSGASPIGAGSISMADGNGGNIMNSNAGETKRAVLLATPGATFARTITLGGGSGFTTYNGISTFNVYNSHQLGGVNTNGTVTFTGPIDTSAALNIGTNNIPVGQNVALLAATGGTVEFKGVINDTTQTTNVTRITINQVRSHPSIDTNADGIVDAAFANQLLGTAQGGTVILSATNTYQGGTEVLGGLLLVNTPNDSGTGTNTVVVTNGAALGGSGKIYGNVIMAAGTTLVPGGYTNIGTLTLTNGLELNGNLLNIDLSNVGTSDKVAVTNGAFVVNGSNYIVLNFPLGLAPAGTYTLITNVTARTGTGNFYLLGSYTNVTLNVAGNNVTLVVGTGGTYANNNLTWKGNLSGTWGCRHRELGDQWRDGRHLYGWQCGDV